MLYLNVYRSGPSNGMPPKPPIRPRHTLQTIEVDDANKGNVAVDVWDGQSAANNRHVSMSPHYVDPQELNTVITQDEVVK